MFSLIFFAVFESWGEVRRQEFLRKLEEEKLEKIKLQNKELSE